MVLLATVGIAALTLVVIQSRKNGTRLAVKATSDKDVDRALSLINTLLMSPDSCKANFNGRPLTGSLSGFGPFKKCNDGTSACNALNFYNPASPDWVMFVGETPSKARLTNITYELKTAQTTGPSHAPATYTIHVFFEKNLGMNNGSITIGKSLVPKDFEIPLVTGLFSNVTHTYTASSTIVGCPVSPSSTIAYP